MPEVQEPVLEQKTKILDESMDEIVHLYTEEKLGSAELAEKYGVDYSTILRRLRKAGVKIRGHVEAGKLRFIRGSKYQEINKLKQYVRTLYVDQKLSSTDISKITGINIKASIPSRTVGGKMATVSEISWHKEKDGICPQCGRERPLGHINTADDAEYFARCIDCCFGPPMEYWDMCEACGELYAGYCCDNPKCPERQNVVYCR